MLKASETVRLVPGLGVTCRITTRTWRLLGVPLLWRVTTERG